MAKHRLPWWHPRVIRLPSETAMIQLSALTLGLFYVLYFIARWVQ